jgi:hypothetical protein
MSNSIPICTSGNCELWAPIFEVSFYPNTHSIRMLAILTLLNTRNSASCGVSNSKHNCLAASTSSFRSFGSTGGCSISFRISAAMASLKCRYEETLGFLKYKNAVDTYLILHSVTDQLRIQRFSYGDTIVVSVVDFQSMSCACEAFEALYESFLRRVHSRGLKGASASSLAQLPRIGII